MNVHRWRRRKRRRRRRRRKEEEKEEEVKPGSNGEPKSVFEK